MKSRWSTSEDIGPLNMDDLSMLLLFFFIALSLIMVVDDGTAKEAWQLPVSKEATPAETVPPEHLLLVEVDGESTIRVGPLGQLKPLFPAEGAAAALWESEKTEAPDAIAAVIVAGLQDLADSRDGKPTLTLRLRADRRARFGVVRSVIKGVERAQHDSKFALEMLVMSGEAGE